ncbi:hypothetical protein MCP1_180094 [Candidatus Terasakiella magnetica]|nr:hypothetical protein MCP1_180094 [Candidatus Terasakiella magnetica]
MIGLAGGAPVLKSIIVADCYTAALRGNGLINNGKSGVAGGIPSGPEEPLGLGVAGKARRGCCRVSQALRMQGARRVRDIS